MNSISLYAENRESQSGLRGAGRHQSNGFALTHFVPKAQIESWQRIFLHIRCLVICPAKGIFFIHGIQREMNH